MAGESVELAAGERDELTPLHPNYVKLMRLATVLLALPFVVGALVLELADKLPRGAFLAPVLLAALYLIVRAPLRRCAAITRADTRWVPIGCAWYAG